MNVSGATSRQEVNISIELCLGHKRKRDDQR